MRTLSMIAAAALAAVPAVPAPGSAVPAGPAPGRFSGTLADGAGWVADVPAHWNHTLILYSHGYGPLTAQDAPDDATRTQLLAEGYALAGSSYSGPSWWALPSAVDDQFGALAAASRITGRPHRTIAWGTSMGGLVSARESEDPRHRVDAGLTTCGLVAGALELNDYQLYGEYALAHLLAPAEDIKLVRYADAADAGAAATRLSAVVAGNQGTAAGRARIALGAVLLNEPGWYTGATPPAPRDYAGQEAQQEQEIAGFVLSFIMTGRQQIELTAGGNSSATAVSTSGRSCAAAPMPPRSGRSTGPPVSTSTPTCTSSRGTRTSPPTRPRSPRWPAPRRPPDASGFPSSTSTRSPTSWCRSSRRTGTAPRSGAGGAGRCCARRT